MSNNKTVMDLKNATGAGIRDCSDALCEAKGNFEQAVEILRKKSIIKGRTKLSMRESKEGKICSVVNGNYKAIFEINSETDFAASNKHFTELCTFIASVISENKYTHLEHVSYATQDRVAEISGIMGEKIEISNFFACNSPSAGVYIHSNDKIGVLVDCDHNAYDVAMQIAAMNPMYIYSTDIPEDIRNKETETFYAECKASGAKENMIDQIVRGKVEKYFKDFVLSEQDYIKDASKKVKDIAGQIRSFVRFAISG